MVSRLARASAGVAIDGLLVGAGAWGALALWFDGPEGRLAAGLLASGFVAGLLGLRLAPRGRGLSLGWIAALALWWLTIQPRNDRDWLPDVARPATAEVRGDRLEIRNLRNFAYSAGGEQTARWETRTYDLSEIRGVDLFLSFWGPALIAHTIMSWEFEEGRHLAISIETRKERGEEYSAIRGFFRQFELYYVVADERDVVRLRTNVRGERVFLYRLATPPDQARALLLAYVRELNHLARDPRWYNALTQNCTTTIRFHVRQSGTRNPWNWRILVNGRADELLYMRGLVDTSLPIAELRERSAISERARAAGDAPDFSRRIREGLPARPPPGAGQARSPSRPGPFRAQPTSASISALSSALIRQPAAATFAFTCSGLVAPAMTEATTGCDTSHEIASSRRLCPRDSAHTRSRSTFSRAFPSRKRSRWSSGIPRRRLPVGSSAPRRYFPVRSPDSSGK